MSFRGLHIGVKLSKDDITFSISIFLFLRNSWVTEQVKRAFILANLFMK